jgi:hypothetical protein
MFALRFFCVNINTVKQQQQSVNNMQHNTALQLNNANVHVTQAQVVNALNNASVTFAQLTYVTTQQTAAKFKNTHTLQKVVTCNVQLFSNINAATSVFKNAVQRNANVQNFNVQSNYFTHTSCYSIVQHNKNAQLYLYAIFNSVHSVTYYVNAQVVTKQQYAQYLTNSAAAQLLSADTSTHNVHNDVTHNVTVRTIKLQNVVALNVNKQQLVAAA